MKPKTLAIALLAVAFAAGPVQAQGRAPGVTDTEITIGLTTPLSGPAVAWGNTAVAMEAWTRYLNDQGGINGRKFKVELKDDGYNPGRAVANLKEMKAFDLPSSAGSARLSLNSGSLSAGRHDGASDRV